MMKADFPSAAELFGGMPPLESVRALLSLFVSHNEEKAKGKRTLAMCDISRAHSMEYQCDEYSWSSLTRRKARMCESEPELEGSWH